MPVPALGPAAGAGEERPVLGKGPAAPSPLGGRICQPTPSSWEGGAAAGKALGQAGHTSELLQLSAPITVERLNMDKCCRFIHNASFYLWNVSERLKDTKTSLETLANQERQPRP